MVSAQTSVSYRVGNPMFHVKQTRYHYNYLVYDRDFL
jgi:hypothetical protein